MFEVLLLGFHFRKVVVFFMADPVAVMSAIIRSCCRETTKLSHMTTELSAAASVRLMAAIVLQEYNDDIKSLDITTF